jgi:hypothetical protein
LAIAVKAAVAERQNNFAESIVDDASTGSFPWAEFPSLDGQPHEGSLQMEAAENYPIERTASGLQYLIPGTGLRTRPNSTKPELPREGDQYMFHRYR